MVLPRRPKSPFYISPVAGERRKVNALIILKAFR